MAHGGSPRGGNEKRGERDDGRLGRERQSLEATTGVTSRRMEKYGDASRPESKSRATHIQLTPHQSTQHQESGRTSRSVLHMQLP